MSVKLSNFRVIKEVRRRFLWLLCIKQQIQLQLLDLTFSKQNTFIKQLRHLWNWEELTLSLLDVRGYCLPDIHLSKRLLETQVEVHIWILPWDLWNGGISEWWRFCYNTWNNWMLGTFMTGTNCGRSILSVDCMDHIFSLLGICLLKYKWFAKHSISIYFPPISRIKNILC